MEAFAQLLSVKTPEATNTWQPIPHIRVRDSLIDALSARSMDALTETVELTHEGSRAFGTFELEGPSGYHTLAGWRNSHDKSLSRGFAVGDKLIVCSNGCFFGDSVVRRKHIPGNQLSINFDAQHAAEIVDSSREVTECRDAVYNCTLYNTRADHLIMEMLRQGVLVGRDILPVAKEYGSPSFEYGRNTKTVWGLQQAATHILKRVTSPTLFNARTRGLINLLDKETAFTLGQDFQVRMDRAFND